MGITLSKKKTEQLTLKNCPYKWENTSLKYLGIHLTPKIEALYDHNFQPLFKKIEKDLKKLELQAVLVVRPCRHLKNDCTAKTTLLIPHSTYRHNRNFLQKVSINPKILSMGQQTSTNTTQSATMPQIKRRNGTSRF